MMYGNGRPGNVYPYVDGRDVTWHALFVNVCTRKLKCIVYYNILYLKYFYPINFFKYLKTLFLVINIS